MSDETWSREEPDSPCIKVCVIHPQARLCVGCYRTIDEIREWPQLGKEARIEIMKGLKSRASQVKSTRKGGRAARRSQSGQ